MELHLVQESRVRDQSVTWVEIDREALLHNLSQIQQSLLPGAEVLAVVKANAYGHGLIEIVRSLEGLVHYYGVATIDEALALRRYEIDTPILLFGVPLGEAIESAIRARVTLSVSSLEQAQEISSIARGIQKPAMVHIKVDTGMGRLGISARTALKTIEQISALDLLELEGVYTHFPQGEDEQDPFTKGQMQTFVRIISQLSSRGVHFAYRHAANSTAILSHRESHFNLVRPGITLYGISPNSKAKPKLDLRPVLSWRTRIIHLKTLTRGDSVGYARTFKAAEETVIGVLPVGYSMGYPFSLSNKGFVLLRGKMYPVVGRVSMDYITVDFGRSNEDVRIGEAVTLLGCEGRSKITAEMLAERAGTIPYEIVTQISPVIPRFVPFFQ